MVVRTQLAVAVAIACLSIVAIGGATRALSCEPPQYSYTDDTSQGDGVIIVEGQGWTRSNDDDCDGSPYRDIEVFLTTATGDRVLVARGAADDDGQFVVNVPISPTWSGRVRVEVSASQSVLGVTTSTPITLRDDPVGSSFGATAVAFGPVQPDRNPWPWLFATAVLSALTGAAVAWRIATRRRMSPTSAEGSPPLPG
jgi:hypothetical protein